MLLSSAFAQATEKSVWVPTSESQIEIRLKYTLGTHELMTGDVRGQVVRNAKGDSIEGELIVPISSIKEGSAKLECHLRESLGLDYRVSDFPKRHVCDDNHDLPNEGKNAVVYHEIRLKIDRVERMESKKKVIGTWTIHGKSVPADELFVDYPDSAADSLDVLASAEFKLADFGIVVKNAFVISVADIAKVKMKLKFKRETTK